MRIEDTVMKGKLEGALQRKALQKVVYGMFKQCLLMGLSGRQSPYDRSFVPAKILF